MQALIDEAEFVFFGHVPAGFSDPAGRIERHAPVPLSFFPALFAALDLDIVLAPLANSAVNECRSNSALLQAGILGYSVIATDIEAHRSLPVVRLPSNHATSIAAIRVRTHVLGAAHREGGALRGAVRAGFAIETWAPHCLTLWTGATGCFRKRPKTALHGRWFYSSRRDAQLAFRVTPRRLHPYSTCFSGVEFRETTSPMVLRSYMHDLEIDRVRRSHRRFGQSATQYAKFVELRHSVRTCGNVLIERTRSNVS